MSDVALKHATALRDRLAEEVRSLQTAVREKSATIKALDDWIANWHQFAQAGVEQAAGTALPHTSEVKTPALNPPAEPERTRTTGNPKKEFVAQNALRIIEEAGQPVSRADLHKELAQRGIHIQGKDPEQVLSTMLWRTRDAVPITRLSSGGYWLAEQPYPATGYVPEQTAADSGDSLDRPLETISDRAPEGSEAAQLQDELAELDLRYQAGDDVNIVDAEYDAKRRRLEELGY